MIKPWPERYPFSSARSRVQLPMDANAFEPVIWGDDGNVFFLFEFQIRDNSKDFVAAGVQVDDPVYVVDCTTGWRAARNVSAFDANSVTVYVPFPSASANVVYKIGLGPLHNLESLAHIIHDRGLHSYTIHWSTLWTQVRFPDYRRDEHGDIYCINPDKAHGRQEDRDTPWIVAPGPRPEFNPEEPHGYGEPN